MEGEGEGEDIEMDNLNDFDLKGEYADDYEDSNHIDEIMDKYDATQPNTLQTTSPVSKELEEGQNTSYDAYEKDHEKKLNMLKEAIKNSKLKYTPSKNAEWIIDRIKIGDNENLYLDKVSEKTRITTRRGGFKLLAKTTLEGRLKTELTNALFAQIIEDPDQTQVKQRIPPMDNEESRIDRQQAETERERVINKVLNAKGQVKTILDATTRELEETGLFDTQAIREIKAAQSAVDVLAKAHANRVDKLTYIDKQLDEAKARGDEVEIKRLEELLKFEREQMDIITNEQTYQEKLVEQIINKAITRPDSELSLKERIKLLLKKGITITTIITAIGMIFTSLGLSIANALGVSTKSTPTPSKPSDPNSIPNKVKDGLKQLAKYLWELSKKSAAAIPGIIGSIVSYLLKSLGNISLFLAEHVLIFLFAAVSFIIYGLIDLGKKLVK